MTIVVFTKWCLPCKDSTLWKKFQLTAVARGYKVKVVRTAYRPISHMRAVKIWGDDDYDSFVVFPNGKVLTMKGAIKMWRDEAKDKRLKPGKEKVENDLQRLRKAKRAIRVDRVDHSATKVKVDISTQNKEKMSIKNGGGRR